MNTEQAESKGVLSVSNIGGIDETELTVESGITILSGRNATNRTSLLQSIMAALGSDNASIKADADEAHVELDIGGETYTRTLQRRNGTIQTSGDPYLEDPTVADLFAFLLESNETRRAVVTDANLRDIIMRPVDTDEIQSEIDQLLDERRQLSDELDELDSLKNRLPSLEEERTQLQNQIEEKQAELEDLEADIEQRDADVEQSRDDKAELENTLEDLRSKRSDLENARYELETEEDSLESLQTEKQEVEDDYENLPETPAGDLDEIESKIDQLRAEKQSLESEVNELQSVIGFNQDLLEDAGNGTFDALQTSAESEEVTDELLPDDTVTCWTCGSDVEADQIETTVEKLQDLSKDTVSDINDLDAELDDLKEQRRERQDQQRTRERLERRQRELESEIEDTEDRIETLAERRDDLREEIKTVEEEVDELEDESNEELLELHKEANQLEYDLGSLESDLERVEDNISSIEERLDEESDLESRREDINDEIEELRTKIERIEQQAIEGFNEHMDTVLETLDYQNIARIWLERTEQEVREGRRKVTKSVFELHIIRQTESGTTYEDSITNLSESEREVTGLIFALAGYLAHEVYETVPFMLLDSLEAIDSDRISRLVDYFAGYSDFLVVALLTEDAQALDDSYHRITEI
ncbi:chromosome segregation protein SMC [Natronomonas gomsonensis]|uniref:archaea-specific SMC-related protein n=1 Tax=Natronomonas gomsonensis TaxID=1046043 RepID=UPI0020CA70D4|nr:archaea-specific SMC-related protein [Natronomonas gomsonensis]MCY4729957.1 chromosome segregation protein SMC [Natronomonas gomsonensis]